MAVQPHRAIVRVGALALIGSSDPVNAGEATAQTPAASAKQVQAVAPAALPEPLTRRALRDVLARLSDAEAGELLIAQLGKEIGAARARISTATSTTSRPRRRPCARRTIYPI
jgi:hypothetical protein